jgi:hypothetical protein
MAVQREAMTRVGEIISLIGVMGSLIFVGLEVRQSVIATRAANDTVIAEAFREINQIMAPSPELARALTAYADDPASAPGAEQEQILGLLARPVSYMVERAPPAFERDHRSRDLPGNRAGNNRLRAGRRQRQFG